MRSRGIGSSCPVSINIDSDNNRLKLHAYSLPISIRSTFKEIKEISLRNYEQTVESNEYISMLLNEYQNGEL